VTACSLIIRVLLRSLFHVLFLRGIKVIIAGAGGAAHLPGMVAALTPLPVIGKLRVLRRNRDEEFDP
jgi:hypothetical protein